LFRNRAKLHRNISPSFSEISGAVEHKLHACSNAKWYPSLIAEKYVSCFQRDYDGVALDYDGTIVPITRRSQKPSRELIDILDRFLDNGIIVVIVSGRGRSLLGLHSQLSEHNRRRVVIALYNGAELVVGAKKKVVHRPLRKKLMTARRMLKSNLRESAWSVELKRYSIQILPQARSQQSLDALTRVIQRYLPNGLVARSSAFAVDVFPDAQLKNACLDSVNAYVKRKIHFLRVGDQGHELGNDYELLNVIGGFSVGTISRSPRGCFPVIDCDAKRMTGEDGTTHLLTKTFDVV
jgi:hypothetical protein